MNLSRYPQETGTMTINGSKLDWSLRRCKGESAFGIHGSRIFELELKKDGEIVGQYDLGWKKKVPKEDDESSVCLTYLLERFGKEKPKKKKD